MLSLYLPGLGGERGAGKQNTDYYATHDLAYPPPPSVGDFRCIMSISYCTLVRIGGEDLEGYGR
jgi:hypothetical protein